MARIEWVRQRLENWALWHERGRGGGLGYATTSVLLADPVDRSREAWIPHDDIEAAETDEAVESLRGPHSDLHRTLHLYYLQGQGVKETARLIARAESTVKAQLARADAVLATWFADRKRQKEATAKAMQETLAKVRPAKLQGVELPPPIEELEDRPTLTVRGRRGRAFTA
jgi:DNA-directed RNA polymerase specialized sigma24 family protein